MVRRFSVVVLGITLGCGASSVQLNPDGGADVSQQSQLCPPCVTDADCNGDVCAQFQGDAFCAPRCAQDGSCPADRGCLVAVSVTGEQVSVCEPAAGICGTDVSPPGPDGGTASNETCGTLVGPDVAARCTSCSVGGASCQANGCYGGWWCDTAVGRCHAPPTNCPGQLQDGGPGQRDATPPSWDAGPVTGSVGANGGTVSALRFAVVGDTRPASIDDTAAYPRTIIATIYADLAAVTPLPQFAIATGDYVFASPSGTQADAQLDLYLQARAAFPNVVFPALGNHECTGGTASNCGPGTADGMTRNYSAFMSKLLGPIGKQDPYYSFEVGALDASWSAKFVFVAANAWSAQQDSWLRQTLARPTTYTFVVRHEPSAATQAPGVTPSQQIIQSHPYTLLFVGHTHTHAHYGKEVVIGNGGAPLTGSGNYGFGLVQQRPDGAIQVDMYDYQSLQPDATFHFAVTPDGTPTP